jgi:hypothetical protein
LNAWNIQTLRP